MEVSETSQLNVYSMKKFQDIESIDLSESEEEDINISEEEHRCNQARLSRRLKIEDERRLLGSQSSDEDSSDEKPLVRFTPQLKLFLPIEESRGLSSSVDTGPLKLRMAKKDRVIRLTDVIMILPKVGGGQGGATSVGILEAHVNGFIYTSSSFRQHIYFEHIKAAFFRLGDKSMLPLLHFHLHRPFMIGTEETKDIEFRLVQENGFRNVDLKDFAGKVSYRWNSQCKLPFDELKKKYQFYGVLPSKALASFALTSTYLIVLVETPFTAVPLGDIEFVNLALLEPEKIDMTVIFQDFKEESVIEINSIPLESLASIKDRLNNLDVKYFVNAKQLDWKATVKGIAAFPEDFIKKGGWEFYQLEDSDTLLTYCDELGLDSESNYRIC